LAAKSLFALTKRCRSFLFWLGFVFVAPADPVLDGNRSLIVKDDVVAEFSVWQWAGDAASTACRRLICFIASERAHNYDRSEE